ncbi:PLP-dependent transferase [Piscinibacter gummiphilus]|uniref:Cystathionine beta-lyase n=1 Tax=Piscinibacter gummiphilus TaxID=946333 RepID=A0A1W6LAD1_9BURK|nr:PLP-dependent transferase [Piscinibacter gummiphilus]ARN21128.1 cystathionine beta-lyase [Piscinibacter gummiphilus]ATU65809.1 cystathionine beta-lyase [Piscinibacter gummiphilus]GLS93682.1 cystathionine beta-lyase [Piscinibacter gummiphilus]
MSKDPRTRLIHHPYVPPAGFGAPVVGVHKASTVFFADTAALQARTWKEKTGYTYGLHGTPTTFMLEERIATLEGGLQTLLVPSGLAALSLVDMALLRSGDEVLIPDNAYGPNKELARHELAAWGIGHRFYDPMDAGALKAMIGPATRLVWLEAPGSVTMEFPDLAELTRVARDAGVLTALDNTWGTGLAFDAFDLPLSEGGSVAVDISVQALTKYASGGGDVLMGSVTTREEALHLRLKLCHMRMGWGVGLNDVEFVLRSLPTLALRYEAQDWAGRRLAEWWATRPEVTHVLHPALPGSPGHEHWRRLSTKAAGLFSVVFDEKYSQAQVHAFVDALRLFKIGFSWAGPVSLVVPYQLAGMRSQPTWKGTLVRFSIGFEAVEDLLADCEQALELL